MIERINSTVKKIIRALQREERRAENDWADLVDRALWIYNTSYHRTLRTTPFFAKMGHHPTEEEMRKFNSSRTYLGNINDKQPAMTRAGLDKLIEEHQTKAAEKMVKYHSKRKVPEWTPGDQVIVAPRNGSGKWNAMIQEKRRTRGPMAGTWWTKRGFGWGEFFSLFL